MCKSFEQLQQEYDKILNSQCFIEEDLDYNVLRYHIPYLDKICEISNSVIMIFDLFKREHIYISQNIERILHINYEKTIGKPDYLNDRIHKDDFLKLHGTGIYFLKYGLSLNPSERKNGKLVNEYRILNEKGNYIRVIEQQVILENDKHNNIWLALGIIDISPDQSSDAEFCSRLIDIHTGKIYMFPPQDKESMLTAREKEILRLISKGLISKQIADKLYISVNTVNTHRQKILEKLNAANTIEAIKYASGLGLI